MLVLWGGQIHGGWVICQVLCAGSPIVIKLALCVTDLSQWKRISMALSAFGNVLLVSSTCAVALLACISGCGCGWSSSVSIWCIKTAVFALMNRAPNSASAANDITAQIICEILRMASLLKGMLSFPAMNMCPPAGLQDFS